MIGNEDNGGWNDIKCDHCDGSGRNPNQIDANGEKIKTYPTHGLNTGVSMTPKKSNF